MTISPACASLAHALADVHPPEQNVRGLTSRIHEELLTASPGVLTRIHTGDLEFLFAAYDRHYFAGLFRQSLSGCALTFRLAPRMTRAGGKTTRFRKRSGETSYEIAIATSMLFEGFRDTDREVTVCGLACHSRLEALQRIFEHELVHLGEQLCWSESSCARARFQSIAARWFGHRSHRHDLITRHERAVEAGLAPGALVSFEFEGSRLSGRINRITRRASVLVEDPAGQPFTDGRRYRVFYVPLPALTRQAAAPAAPGADRAGRW